MCAMKFALTRNWMRTTIRSPPRPTTHLTLPTALHIIRPDPPFERFAGTGAPPGHTDGKTRTMMFRLVLTAVAAAGRLAPAMTPARAEEPIVLKFAYPAPPEGWLVTKGTTPWIKKVEEASGGLVQIK